MRYEHMSKHRMARSLRRAAATVGTGAHGRAGKPARVGAHEGAA